MRSKITSNHESWTDFSAVYREAMDEAIDMMNAHHELEPRSALKQAGSDWGIPYGDEMGAFVAWAENEFRAQQK